MMKKQVLNLFLLTTTFFASLQLNAQNDLLLKDLFSLPKMSLFEVDSTLKSKGYQYVKEKEYNEEEGGVIYHYGKGINEKDASKAVQWVLYHIYKSGKIRIKTTFVERSIYKEYCRQRDELNSLMMSKRKDLVDGNAKCAWFVYHIKPNIDILFCESFISNKNEIMYEIELSRGVE